MISESRRVPITRERRGPSFGKRAARKLRAEGKVTINEKNLGGAIELGVARHLLNCLPKAEEVFAREHDGYMWTAVHFSRTLDKPQQDLSPRIVEALKESPGAALGAFFRGLGEWLKDAFGAE